eukprot:2149740-Amphidinium_carterae.3
MVVLNVLGYVLVHWKVTATDEGSVARKQAQMSYLTLLCNRATSWLTAMTVITVELPAHKKILGEACMTRQACRNWKPEGCSVEVQHLVDAWIRDSSDITKVHDGLDMEGLWLKVEKFAAQRLKDAKEKCEALCKGKPNKESWLDDYAPDSSGAGDFSAVVVGYKRAAEKHLLRPAFATEMKTVLNTLVKDLWRSSTL